jgi:hypothetical protein
MNNFDLNLLTFPIWWYTHGLALLWAWAKRRARYDLRATGLVLFSRHMAEPMFGDYTRSGRMIGLFLRFFLLLGKLIMLLFRVLFIVIVLLVYILIIPFSIIMIINQLFVFGGHA